MTFLYVDNLAKNMTVLQKVEIFDTLIVYPENVGFHGACVFYIKCTRPTALVRQA